MTKKIRKKEKKKDYLYINIFESIYFLMDMHIFMSEQLLRSAI